MIIPKVTGAPLPEDIEIKVSSVYNTKGMPKREAQSRAKSHAALAGMFEKKADEYWDKTKRAAKEGAYKYADLMYSKMRQAQDQQFRFAYIKMQLDKKS